MRQVWLDEITNDQKWRPVGIDGKLSMDYDSLKVHAQHGIIILASRGDSRGELPVAALPLALVDVSLLGAGRGP